ncbi:transglutaminase domain-containing protein [Bacteroides caecigallinarum]|uniref:transglutaminase domain-containing protein n=1 Tax=Bacteroides caecigallinarum TaxID=1411144 RepID=UPI001F2DB87D|nr:transglutaminase domain-containing protein [Bacteroides caecigallinarum]MCF2582220.1 transglutaminase domain-containing protein [Bacteroides caecigallinarum]
MFRHLFFSISLTSLCLLSTGCNNEKHFINDSEYLSKVENDFTEKKTILKNGELFDIFNEKISTEEKEALQFLYAYMTLSDIADHSGEYFLDNIRLSFKIREASSWGKNIPEDIFRHFVLPIRVNNENLDNSREYIQNELWPRVKHLSMYDAVLEANHWCHEKAIYTPSDIRTSSPLATIKTAYGRCGEESTLLVAALRAIGIPARQVYTPRWAHTDDNHAWVEAWVDGEWFFLGACEPEPVLNLGWFNSPASRGMLMHTKVFGSYNGKEEKMLQTANYTEINIIENYADKASVTVTVKDDKGNTVEGANVEFKIYNYGEFFTVYKQKSNTQGQISLSAGLGDMLVYASHGDKFCLRKVSFGKDKTVDIVLEHNINEAYSENMVIVPPSENAKIPSVTEEQRKENDIRMHQEDSIRNAYLATFPNKEVINKFAEENNLKYEDIEGFIVKSRGNYAEIMRFLSNSSQNEMCERAIELLKSITDKDLRDTPCSVLEDHLYNTPKDANPEYVLCPRVAYELLSPYRSYLQKEIPENLKAEFTANPQTLVKWCSDSITVRNDLNTGGAPTSPIGTWKSRVVDSQSREIFFVAAARSLNIPAWKDAVTGNIYFIDNGNTNQVDFEISTTSNTPEGTLKAIYKPIPRLNDPKYYTNFTISKYEDGSFKLLNYPENATWSSLLKNGLKIEEGYYMLTTGSRMANGSVMSNVSFFTVEKDKETRIELTMRNNAEEIRVIGNFNSELKYTDVVTKAETSILSTTGRGYFVVGILGPGQEPTNHALKDIEIKKEEFEKWGRKMILLFPDEKSYRKFSPTDFPNLPSNIVYGIDTNNAIRNEISQNMKLPNGGHLPIFIIGDTFNRVVFQIDGYTIGTGEQLIKTINGL